MDRERMVKEFCRLVSIDSPSFSEREMADYLIGVFAENQIMLEEDEAGSYFGGNSGNLYGYWKGTLEGAPILFSMHMDTVEPAKGKKAVVHEDGKITSDGTTVLGADDLAAIAEVIEAVRSITEQKSAHRDVEFLISIAEEQHLRGSQVFDFSRLKAKESYVLDKTGQIGSAAVVAPSLATFEAVVRGKAAHAGFAPEEGVNAVLIASKAVTRIPLGHVGTEMTVNIGSIQSDFATNIVPSACTVKGEVRSFSHEAVLRQLKDIQNIFEEEAAMLGGVVEYQEDILFQAYVTPENAEVVRRYEDVCKRLGIKPVLERTFGGSDQNHLSANGVRGMVLASAMQQAHSGSEYTTVSDMEKVTKIVMGLMESEI